MAIMADRPSPVNPAAAAAAGKRRAAASLGRCVQRMYAACERFDRANAARHRAEVAGDGAARALTGWDRDEAQTAYHSARADAAFLFVLLLRVAVELAADLVSAHLARVPVVAALAGRQDDHAARLNDLEAAVAALAKGGAA